MPNIFYLSFWSKPTTEENSDYLQPCSSCGEVDTLVRDFAPPAKDRWPAGPQQWTQNA